jgi:hypothetical protein
LSLSSAQLEGSEPEFQFKTISSIGLFPNLVIKIQAIRKMAAISKETKIELFFFWRKADIIVTIVAIKTSETNKILNE